MKKMGLAIAIFLTVFLCAASAMAWGPATHAYIGERLLSKGPLLTLNQAYGSMAGDVFNMMAAADYRDYLSVSAHCAGLHNMWNAALLPTAKAQAYGFVSHNQEWGADFFAHNYGCPDNSPPTRGYIEMKARKLASRPEVKEFLDSLDVSDEFAMELLRDLVEYAVDILVARLDGQVGAKISSAALLRSSEFPLLLNATYAADLAKKFNLSYWQATKIISSAEIQFRQIILAYGQVFAPSEAETIYRMSNQLALFADQFYGIEVDPEDIGKLIILAMKACKNDYYNAIKNTIDQVRLEMVKYDFAY